MRFGLHCEYSPEGAQLAVELWKPEFWYSLLQVLAYLKINICGSCWDISMILKLYVFLDKIAALAGFLPFLDFSCDQKYCVRKYTEDSSQFHDVILLPFTLYHRIALKHSS